MEEVDVFAHRLRNVLKDPVYSNGVDPESIIAMIEDMAMVCNGKKKHVRVPRPLEGIAPMLSIRFCTSSRGRGRNSDVLPLSYEKQRRSRRTEARNMSTYDPCSNSVGEHSTAKDCDYIVKEIEKAMKQYSIRSHSPLKE